MRKQIAFLPALWLLMFCFSLSISAQETTGEIQGTVKDPTGAVVPNVTINMTGLDVGFNRTVQTDTDGFFRARQIPPGIYKVSTAALSGFAEQTKDRVQVALGNTTTADFILSAGAVSGVVNVTSDSGVIVDATETKSLTSISARQIDALPKGTNFTSLLRTTAAVRPEPLSGQYSINGATGPENSFIIDGQETQNFRNGLLNANNDIPYQALQEIQVRSSGFEAEFGGATGGVITGVTKSGTNQFRGEFGTMFETQRLNAAPRPVLNLTSSTTISQTDVSSPFSGQGAEYFYQARPRGSNFFPTGSFGGPIIKDKAWFYAIYSPRVYNQQGTTNYIQGYGATRVPYVIPSSSPLYNTGVSLTQTFPFKRTYEFAQFRLDAQPLNSLRLSSSYTYNTIVDEGAAYSGSSVVGSPGYATVNGQVLQGSQLAAIQGGRQNSNNFRSEATWTPNSKFVGTLRYTRGFLNQKLGSYGVPTETRFICSSVSAALAASAGCITGFQSNTNNLQINKDVSIRNTVDANGSYLVSNFLGRHEFKGGYQFSRILNDVDYGSTSIGRTYLYYGVTSFAAGTLCGSWYIPSTITAPANAIGRGCTYRFATQGKATNTANTFYAQDKWQPTTRLTFNLGVRTENEEIPAFNNSTINLKFGYGDKIAPRLGAAYALTADGKTKISAFYGWFYDRLKFELPRGSFGGDFYRVDYFFITSDHPGYTYYMTPTVIGNFTSPVGGSCVGGSSTLTTGSLVRCDIDYRIPSNLTNSVALGGGSVDPDLKPYRQSEFTFEFQREVMRASVLTARYLHRNLDQVVEDAGSVNSQGSEAYIIGNPGEGLHAQTLLAAGYTRLTKPQRVYDGLQLEYDTRFFKKASLNLNYTLSRLYGNYSGLASPDENGRTSPNVDRDFDLPFVGFTASGNEAKGRLPLDRPHVFKASGTYSFDWWNSKTHSTDFSFFTTAQSGTPQTTFVTVFGIPIVETTRGDLGRTEVFTQTDLNLTHRYRFGRDNRFTMAVDFNVLNVFNENNVLQLQTTKNSAYFGLSTCAVDTVNCSYVAATNILTSGGILAQYAAAEQSFVYTTNVYGVNAARRATYKLPLTFQDPRSVRFGFRLIF